MEVLLPEAGMIETNIKQQDFEYRVHLQSATPKSPYMRPEGVMEYYTD
jgi:hypothetical protein